MNSVRACSARQDVQVRFPDGRTFCGPKGTPLGRFVSEAMGQNERYVAARVEGQLRELDWAVHADCLALPISLAEETGYRLYQASAVLLLEAALRDVLPEARLQVEHSVPLGGLYCELEGHAELTAAELEVVAACMREIVEAEDPIERETVTADSALTEFEQAGERDRVRLLRSSAKDFVEIRTLLSGKAIGHAPLLPSAGGVCSFGLSIHAPGFILQLPRRRGGDLSGTQSYPKLSCVFTEYGRWLRLLGVEDVGALNEALQQGRGRELMLVGESLHAQRITEIAARILAGNGSVRVILIAGPSSAGKTSFAKRLAIQLISNGIRPHALSLDDYFLPRESTPLGEDGKPDFESLNSLDVELLGSQLRTMLSGKRVSLPRYNFITGQRESGQDVRLDEAHVLLIEGLHGLNPELLPVIDDDAVFRVYVSALTQLRLDRLTRIPTTDTRLIRRIVRDSHSRGYNAQMTLARWPSVRMGEERNIFPFQENADEMFNSAMPHEVSVLRPLAEPLLRQVEPGTPEYIEARRLLDLLSWVEPCELDLVPEESILREFLGGSVVVDFVPREEI